MWSGVRGLKSGEEIGKFYKYKEHGAFPWHRALYGASRYTDLLSVFIFYYEFFLSVSVQSLLQALHLLNHRPRKCFQYKTPAEALLHELQLLHELLQFIAWKAQGTGHKVQIGGAPLQKRYECFPQEKPPVSN